MIEKKGKIKTWNDEKGFGFIAQEDTKKQIFVHIKSFKNRSDRPKENQSVSFTISKDKQGRRFAKDVSRVSDISPKNHKVSKIRKRLKKNNMQLDYKSTHNISFFSIIIILSFLSFLVYSLINGKLPLLIIILYIIIGIITYIAYSIDKSKAIDQEYRISEKSLLLLSLVGGWLGAIVAQQRFRHKTKKTSFQVIFWITVFVNILLLVSQFKLV